MTSTELTNTTLESDLASTGLCADCLKGFSFSGTPKGKTIQLSKFDTVYIASNEESKGKPAILMLTDVFGFALVNPKLIADELHEHTGFAVYVPDLFNGKPLAADALETIETPEEERARGVWDKIKFGLSVAPIVPWFLRNRPASKLEPLKALIQELKGSDLGHTKIGTIGYCYGGKLGAILNIDGTSNATVLAHPSLLDKADLDHIKTPTRFLLAELDTHLDDNMVAYAKSTTQTSGTVAEFTQYPGTCHGFASRGNLSNENIRKAFEGHVIESVAWFKKYLS